MSDVTQQSGARPQARARPQGRASRCYWRVWHRVRRALRPLHPIRVNAIVAGVLVAMVMGPDQSHDVLRSWVRAGVDSSMVQYTLASGAALCLGFYFTTRNLLLAARSRRRAIRIGPIAMGALPSALACVPPLALALGFWRARATLADPAGALGGQLGTWMLVMAGAVVVTGAVGAATALVASTRAGQPRDPASGRARWLRRVTSVFTGTTRSEPVGAIFIICFVPVSLLFVVGAVARPQSASVAGPMAAIYLSAFIWILLLNVVVATLDRVRLPLVSILLVTSVLFGWLDYGDNHDIRRVGQAPPVPGPDAAFDAWIEARVANGRVPKAGYPIFVVATEGGGIRAAYWTAAVLATLEDENPGFAEHVFAISGVSGGSLGATVFAALTAESNLPEGTDNLRAAGAVLSQDYLSPVLARGLTVDLLQRFWPAPVAGFDRARAIELSLEHEWVRTMRSPTMPAGFFALRRGPRGWAVPHLLLNTTSVETGARVPVAHVNPWADADHPRPTLHAFLDQDDLPLSTAAFLSSRFPVVMPAGSVEVPGGKRRFVDGGYFENSGTATAGELIHALMRAPSFLSASYELGIELHVIEIRFDEPRASAARGPHSFAETMSPLRTLLATRGARGRASRRTLDSMLADARFLRYHVDPQIIRFELADRDVPLPLGWSLSGEARDAITRLLDEPQHRRARQRVADVLDDPRPGDAAGMAFPP